MSVVLETVGVSRSYVGGDGVPIHVLTDVAMEVRKGEFVAIVGASGAGKSTLLHLLGALDRPTAGDVLLNGISYGSLGESALALLRNRAIGFVFQFHHLLREFSALENVAMPLRIAGSSEQDARDRAASLLASVGLSHRLTHLPSQLSGGEQQRVAVARALAPGPQVILADEPSGNLDHYHAEVLHDLFAGLADEWGTALVVVTHNTLLAGRADRTLTVDAGRLVPYRDSGVVAS